MKIELVEIGAFGKLSSYALNLNGGFEIIHGDNEYGKTTIMSFIKMMFYSDQKRSRDIEGNIRKKYQPWDRSAMSGAVEFICGGERYRLQKDFGETAAKDKTALISLKTGENVSLPGGAEAGKHFFGLDLAGFERSSFIGTVGSVASAAKTSDKNDDTVAERLMMNLIETGDQSAEQQVALSRLKAAGEELISKNGKNGRIPLLSDEIEALKAQQAETLYILEQQAGLINEQKEVAAGLALYKSLTAGLAALKAKERLIRLDELSEKAAEYKEQRRAVSGGIPAAELPEFIKNADALHKECKVAAASLAAFSSGGDVPPEKDAGLESLKAEAARNAETVAQLFPAYERYTAKQAEAEALKSRQLELLKAAASAPEQSVGGRLRLPFLLVAAVTVLLVAAAFLLFQNPLVLIGLPVAAALLIPAFSGKKKSSAPAAADGIRALESEISALEAGLLSLSEDAGAYDSARRRQVELDNELVYKSEALKAASDGYKSAAASARERYERLCLEFTEAMSAYGSVQDYDEAAKTLELLISDTAGLTALKDELRLLAATAGMNSVLPDDIKAARDGLQGPAASAPDGVTADDMRRQLSEMDHDALISRSLELERLLKAPDTAPETLIAEISEKQQALDEMKDYYAALTLAYKTMSEAADELRNSFGPELCRRTGEILSRLTLGKYSEVLVDRDYKIQVKCGTHYREYPYLSNGTVDQVYLSLRLAVSELISGGDPMPVFLDDVLMQYDDKRVTRCLEFFKEYSESTGTQILLFTCHSHISGAV